MQIQKSKGCRPAARANAESVIEVLKKIWEGCRVKAGTNSEGNSRSDLKGWKGGPNHRYRKGSWQANRQKTLNTRKEKS